VLDGASALERACAARAGQGDVVHFACHGEFYPAQPWDSCLFLAAGPAGSPADDGKLRAAEVLGLDLARARLVTLSGCETGRGAVLAGDDTVGLGTAFLHAGAGALLVSLWRVEDRATSALMTAFYKKWMGERKDKVTALYEAKLELLRGAAPEPRQWGAFILTGEP
jgi:CHAT domain-containing protein